MSTLFLDFFGGATSKSIMRNVINSYIRAINYRYPEMDVRSSLYLDDFSGYDTIFFFIKKINLIGGGSKPETEHTFKTLKTLNRDADIYIVLDDIDILRDLRLSEYVKHLSSYNSHAYLKTISNGNVFDNLIHLIKNNMKGYLHQEIFKFSLFGIVDKYPVIPMDIKPGIFSAHSTAREFGSKTEKLYNMGYLGSSKKNRIGTINSMLVPNTFLGGSISKLFKAREGLTLQQQCSRKRSQEIRDASISTVIIGASFHNNTGLYQRVCEGLFSDCITLITPYFDPDKKIITHRMKDHIIVRNSQDIMKIIGDRSLTEDIRLAEGEFCDELIKKYSLDYWIPQKTDIDEFGELIKKYYKDV